MVTKRLQYRYDAVGNKVGMTDADGGLFTYTYDVMRRLTGVINPLGERTTYTYDLNGRRTSAQLANGTRTSYSYDQGSRVQQIHTLKSNNSTVAKFDYAYDNNGRRTSVLEADGSRVTWTYDGTSQVTSEWRTGTSPFRHTFVYDTRGNRTLKIEDGARTTLVYDAANQLSSSEDAGGTTNYTYDANGNQHLTVAPGGLRTTQIWDYENRLVRTLQPGGGVFTMAYDADGLRVRKETPSETKLFVWDDQNYLAETDDSGVTEVAYTTEPSTYGSTISHRSGGATTTYHFDALAAARVLTNASETVLESYNYTAFGTILGTPTVLTPFLWGGLVGYYWDADLATQYIRARHYQPNIARWISLDPIGFEGGDANLFRYVGNSPTSGPSKLSVRLAASTYGQPRLFPSTILLDHLSLTRMNTERRSRIRIDGIDPTGTEDWSRGGDDERRTYETARIHTEIQTTSNCELQCGTCVGNISASIHYHALIGGDEGIARISPSHNYGLCVDGKFHRFEGSRAAPRDGYPYYKQVKKTVPIGQVSCAGGGLNKVITVTTKEACGGGGEDGRIAEILNARLLVSKCGKVSAITTLEEVPVKGKYVHPLRCLSCFEAPYPPYNPKDFPDEE